MAGRKRAFDIDEALDAAMQVFWAKGYEGTSLEDLTAAMAINRASLYNAFGSKELLFRKVVERYEQRHAAIFREALQADSVASVVRLFLSGFVELATDRLKPGGCLGFNAAVTCSSAGETVRRLLIERRNFYRDLLRARFERDRDAGRLGPNQDPKTVANYVMIVVGGISLQARAGVSGAELHDAARIAASAIG